MGAEIDSLPHLEPVDLTDPHYLLAMKDLLGRDLANKLERQMGLTGAYEEIPPQWKHTIFFNDLKLKWNQDASSFRYRGMVGIGNIGDIQVNKKVEAYIELVERGSGDLFDIYLRADDNAWYYIAYSPGGLQVLSSNRVFNEIVFDLKASTEGSKAGWDRLPMSTAWRHREGWICLSIVSWNTRRNRTQRRVPPERAPSSMTSRFPMRPCSISKRTSVRTW